MRELIGLFFGVISTLLLLLVGYCVFMALVVEIAWIFVGIGVALSAAIACAITYICLKTT